MNKKLSELEIEERIKQINDAMSQEGMPLSEELILKLRRCFSGDTTIAEERQKTIEKYNVLKSRLVGTNYGKRQ